IEDAGLLRATMDIVLERILFYLDFRAQGKIKIECILYSNEFGLLAESQGFPLWGKLSAQLTDEGMNL
ncbi:MAG: hypothetical protein J6M63_03110, partial [Pseudobutyrivibrio sp.]|nr:hypothetical protein [Pseudobutyrivibrio sp.]